MKETELKKLRNKTLAEVCDGMSKVSRGMMKEAKGKKQKGRMLEHARHFKALGKVFRSLK